MEIKRKNRKHNTIYRLSVGNINFNKLLDSIKFSRKDFNTKFRNTGYKPYREVLYNGRKYISTNILKISKLKKRKMVADFTIEKTHTFLANGILTSNCHHGKSNTWRRIPALCSNAIYKHGFSGTPWDFASQNIELEAVCGPIKQRLTASALIKLGYLARPYITFHRYDGAGRLIDGQNLHTVYENGIMNNKHRNKKILEVVDHEYRENNAKLLLVVQRIKHGHILSDLLRKLGIHDREIGYLHGGSKGKVREEGRREFEKGDIRIMIVSNIWNEGIDIPSCDVLVKADAYGGGDVYEGEGVRSLLQQIGRVLRKPIPNGWDDVDTETEHTVRVHDFADKCHKWIENWTRNRMRSCKMEEEWVVDVK